MAFYLQKGNIFAVPIIHYNMEMAAQVRLAFQEIKPTCIAVELPETMQLQLLHAASRLPDISVVLSYDRNQQPLFLMAEPCEGTFEGLRSALEAQIPAYCIDLDVEDYPATREPLPDPYAITRIGLDNYYDAYQKIVLDREEVKSEMDLNRELYMARRLKDLSLTYDRVLFIGGMYHVQDVLKHTERTQFPAQIAAVRDQVELCTLTEASCRDVMAESGWFSSKYEESRSEGGNTFPPDRQALIFDLYKQSGREYSEETRFPFPGYNLRNIMKYVRNYALLKGRLMPDLFQILCAARGCVTHNYAYQVWEIATAYPHLKNIDNLPALDLTVEDVWKHSKSIRFHLKEKGRKEFQFHKRNKDRSKYKFQPPGPFNICSYPPEDVIVESFGDFLKKKGTQIAQEDSVRSVPFSTSLEDGLDTRESIRHWSEKKLYVKVSGKPPGGVGSIVVIFDEDKSTESNHREKYPWRATWLGEHSQESDMALYATPIGSDVVGPGISHCEYGGFMMSYPPRRLFDVWSDPDYQACRSKSEVLLAAAIDYATKPLVVYVAATPPRPAMKQFAQAFGKKVVYIPIGQLSPITLRKIRNFHVLDGYDRRGVANEYID